MMTDRIRVAALLLAVIMLAWGCGKNRLIWEQQLGETVKVQTDPLLVTDDGIVVTWAAEKTSSEEKSFIIPRVNTVKPGIHMSAEKNVFRAYLAAFSVVDGSLRWKSEYLGESDQNTSSPVYYDGRIYVGADNGNLYEIYSKDGTTSRIYENREWIHLRPVVTDDMVIFADEKGYLTFLDKDDFKKKGKVEAGYSQIDFIYHRNGILYAVKNSITSYGIDGSRRAQYISRDKYSDFNGMEKRGAHIMTGLCAADGFLYFGTSGSFVHKVSLSHMEDAWSQYVEGLSDSLPLVHEDAVFFGTGQGALALDREKGEVSMLYGTDNRWMDYNLKFRRGGAVRGGFCIDDDVVYFGGRDYTLYGYSINDGRRVFRYAIKNKIGKTTPLSVGDMMIFGADSRRLYAVRK